MSSFSISEKFINKYKRKKPPFGFNGLGELVYRRTYSRIKENGDNEQWWETVKRVVEGTFSIQKEHIDSHSLGWNAWKAQRSAQVMYDKIFNMKFLPPGRGLWAMGTSLTKDRKLFAALNNCGFCSTEMIGSAGEFSKPFCFLMDASMLGVGVGFDVKGAGKVLIKGDKKEISVQYKIPDTREGWVESLRMLLDSYAYGTSKVEFDYSLIRGAGQPIKGFGGISSGPKPLIDLHDVVRRILDSETGSPISITAIVDIMNLIGKCVVAGNIRRCLPEGTEVHTKHGLKNIEDVKVGDLVKTSKGFFPVSENVYQGKQEVVTIITENGKIECTEKHKIAVINGIGEYTWKQAVNISKGDMLVFCNNAIEGSDTKLPEWSYEKPKNSKTCKDILIPDLNYDMGWFLGLFHGDGYTHVGKNQYISVSCSEEHPEIIEKVSMCIKSFGVNLYTVPPSEKDRSFSVRAASKQLALYLSKFKKPKTTIDIPLCIKQGSINLRASYLAGLFDADGSSKNRPTVLVCTVYERFAEQVQNLYASLGIPTRIKYRPAQQENWQDKYEVCLIGEKATAFFENIVSSFSLKYSNNNKTARSQNDYGYPSKMIIDAKIRYGREWSPSSKQMTVSTLERCSETSQLITPVKVVSDIIRTGKECETYDLSVPEVNEFVINQGFLVHNTAEIVFGDYNSEEYLDLKNYEVNPHRAEYGWTSNNSVFADIGMDYKPSSERINLNGEPGFAWLKNMQDYGRMVDLPNYKDKRAVGGNPCLEQTLESFELCCLVETFPDRHDSLQEYLETLKYAYLYAKTVTLGKTHWPETNRVMLRNRRIGCSMSGIAQFIANRGVNSLTEWMDTGYGRIQELDEIYSDWMAIPKSIKTTSIKPSGSVSLLCGSTPGIHFPESRFYIRRMRLKSDSPLVAPLKKAGYKIEPAFGAEDTTSVVEIPVDVGEGVRTLDGVSMWEQLSMASLAQRYWADNQVSCTVTFNPETEGGQISNALDIFQYQLKGISFLPRLDHGAYPQMPYESIDEKKYNKIKNSLQPVKFGRIKGEKIAVEKFCDNDVCEIDFNPDEGKS